MSQRALINSVVLLATAGAPALAQINRGPFDAPLVVAGQYQMITDVADRDGDGWSDAYGWWESNLDEIKVQAWRNDHAGNLVLDFESSSIDVGGYANAGESAVGDFDLDGRDDYAVAAGEKLLVFRSNGLGPPTLVQTLSSFWEPSRCVAFADFTGDGYLDLACLRYGNPYIYGYDPAAAQFVLTSQVSGDLEEFVVADVTGDGSPDIIGAVEDSWGHNWSIRVLPVVGGALQAPSTFFAFGGQNGAVPAVGDIDSDGDNDIVLFGMGDPNHSSGPQPPRVAVVRCDATNTLVPEPLHDGGPARRLVDIDFDGDLDAVCCGGGTYYRPVNYNASTFRVALNLGTGQFTPAIELAGMGSTRIAGATDIDHDGDIDLVAGRCIYYARGPITSAIASSVTIDAPPAAYEQTHPRFDAECDLDADGDPDFTLSADFFAKNLADGTTQMSFVPRPPLTGGFSYTPFREALGGDFDGDGLCDSLVYFWNSPGELRTRLLRGLGGLTFVDGGDASPGFDPVPLGPSSSEAYGLRRFDVDADGDLDIVAPYYNVYSPSRVWENDGTGHFRPGFTCDPELDNLCAFGDFDGDGFIDAVSTAASVPMLRLRRGLGNAAFGPAEAVAPVDASDFRAPAVTSGDFDDDGDLDLAAVTRRIQYHDYLGGLHVFVNDGSGVFSDTLIDTYGTSGATLRAFDVDGDARLDLVSTHGDAHALLRTHLRKTDNSGYEPAVEQIVARGGAMSATDADGDGDVDVITDRVYRNRRWLPPASGVKRQLLDGVAGTGSFVPPTMGGFGPFRVGSSVRVQLRGARPATTGWFYGAWIATAPPVFGGGPMIAAQHQRVTSVIPITTSGTATDPAGSGSWDLPYVVPEYKAGRTYAYFVELDDVTAPSGSSRSNTLRITYGP